MFSQSPLEGLEAIWQKHCLWTTSLHTALCTLHNTHCTIWTWWTNALLMTISLLNSVQCSPSSVHFAVLWWMSALSCWFHGFCVNLVFSSWYIALSTIQLYSTPIPSTPHQYTSLYNTADIFSHPTVWSILFVKLHQNSPTILCVVHCLFKTFPQLILNNIQTYFFQCSCV